MKNTDKEYEDLFSAYRVFQKNDTAGKIVKMNVNDLSAGEVLVQVCWSSINYKDFLAATDASKIIRRPALNGGVDLSGTVVKSDSKEFKVGDRVFACGAGLSEVLDGGYAEFARLPAQVLQHVPESFSLREVMAIGTAGFTAALAIHCLEKNSKTEINGAILVTASTGGVGGFAINMLSQKGYQVTALTGNLAQQKYLTQLGAKEILDRKTLKKDNKPLEKSLWDGAIDSAGGDILSWILSTTKPWGNVATIGMIGGSRLNTTVMPFILRGVSLLGINSTYMSDEMRKEVWNRIENDLKPSCLNLIVKNEIRFEDLPGFFQNKKNKAKLIGRTLVKIS